MRAMRFAIAAVLLAVTAGQTQAAFIVDTGIPTGSPKWTYNSFQYFAGEFSLSQSYTLDGIEAYFSSGGAGNVTIALHSDGGNIPGSILNSAVVSVPVNTGLGWHGVSGLSWNVSPGTYWVSFTPSSSIDGIMPGVAPSALNEYAQGSAGVWQDEGANSFDYLGIGVRISASQGGSTVTPEPTSLALAGFAGIGMAVGAWRRRRQQAA